MANQKKVVRDSSVDFGNSAEVHLGDHSYQVVPQRIGRLRSKLGLALGGLADLELSSGTVVGALGERVYAVLEVFIPDLMPEWEFNGFATKEAMEADSYAEEYDKSPSPTQVKLAVQAAMEVNEIDLLKHLGNLIGPNVIRAYLAGAIADSLSGTSENSVAPSGDTTSTPSGTTLPTSVSSAA